jgi:uncharacterized membrane protein SpoIIM required for sporulation
MNVDEFARDRGPTWDELRDLCDRAGRKPQRLGAAGVLRLGACYRSAVADLATARRRFPQTPVAARLEVLVGRARPLVYARGTSTTSLGDWVLHGYWRRVRERPPMLLAAAAGLLLPMLLTGYWAWRDPVSAEGIVPSQFQAVTEPRVEGDDLGIPVDEQAKFASQIFTNNIRVAAMAFGAGVLLGLGTLFFLGYNGVLLGAVGGLAIDAGNTRSFLALVSAHGVLELSCIVVAGAAGLRMGWAVVAPGTRSRLDSLQAEARAAVEMMLGTAVWLVVAGLIEGFVTPSGIDLEAALAIGFGAGGLYWALLLFLGRARAVPPATDELAA